MLASVFAAKGGYGSGHQFVSGTVPAVMVGAAVVVAGAAAAFALPRGRRTAAVEALPAVADLSQAGSARIGQSYGRDHAACLVPTIGWRSSARSVRRTGA